MPAEQPMIIYKAVNNINGKIYIGQTVHSINKRISQHSYCNCGIFPRALRKYGAQSFAFSVIDHADSLDILNEKEIYWIAKYNCQIPLGYNLTNGGGGTSGFKHSEEYIKQKKGSKLSEETKRKIGLSTLGRKHTEEAKAKMSKAATGRKVSEKLKKYFSELYTGRRLSEETKKKIGEAGRGSHRSEETKKKMSEAAKKRGISKETRAKIIQSQRNNILLSIQKATL